MKNNILISAALLVLTSLRLAVATDESITITTYYPSPYGVYNELTTYSHTNLAIASGNVGIGTSSPQAKLDVRGKIRGDLSDNIYAKYNESGCDTGKATVQCDAGDIAIAGGGSCSKCLTGTSMMEFSWFIRSGPDQIGWEIGCDENGNATYDGGWVQVICLKKD